NAPRFSFFVIMNCLNGMFQDPRTESLAAALMKAPSGGAVGVWASSGLTEPGQQSIMDEALVPLLYQGLTVGEAAVRAKAAITDEDTRRTWIIFGDPATRLKQ
ncbi:MAG TPA: C25 family cysteine peptidase, partial [Candidatus Binatia bacterium]